MSDTIGYSRCNNCGLCWTLTGNKMTSHACKNCGSFSSRLEIGCAAPSWFTPGGPAFHNNNEIVASEKKWWEFWK